MGKKANPYGLRVGISKPWKSRWYATGIEFVNNIQKDLKVKKLIKTSLGDAGISDIYIERSADQTGITIATSRPGVVIGRQGAALEELKAKICVLLQNRNVDIKVEEIRNPEVVASLIAQNIAKQIERRIPYRRSCKQAVEKAMETRVKGCKIRVSGRLNGAEIARSEVFSEGRIPLQTLRANIDYVSTSAATTYGKIGIKVWVYHGDMFADKKELKAAKRVEFLEIEQPEVESKVEKVDQNDNANKKNIDSAIEI
jgi:small subunit ribosomal protein S3